MPETVPAAEWAGNHGAPATGGGPGRSWCDGWWSPAQVCVSPNQGPRPGGAVVDLVVVHSISLPPGKYGGAAIEQLFTNTLDPNEHPYFERLAGLRVSAHFVIRRNGSLMQFVSCDRRAWHAGHSQWRGRDNCNDFSIGIELEGLEGLLFTGRQYQRLAGLIQHLCSRYPLRDVAGHEHIAPGRKGDPGLGFDWTRLAQALHKKGPASALQLPQDVAQGN